MPDGNDPRRARLRARAAATLEAGMAASLVFGRLSCPAGGTGSTQQGPPTVAIPPAPQESEALDLLRKEAVLSSAPARQTLYTWTTRAQIEELARDRVLLTRTESPVHGPAYYDQIVAARAAAGDALAQKLRTPAFAKARHAWANPWATLLGWPDESYGDELIAVTLKPEAWTLALSTSKEGWKAYDRDNPSKAPRPPSIDDWNTEVARKIWPGPDLIPALDQAYEAALAFPNENYALTPERIAALAKRLRAIGASDPAHPKLTHVPTTSPSGRG
jgi:hypothetical protein